jgi:hypothetical protein
MKMAVSKAFTSKRNPIVTAAVLVLLAAGVRNLDVVVSVVPDAISTAEAVTTRYQQVVESRSAEAVPTLCNFMTAGPFLFAGDVMAGWLGEIGGLASDAPFCCLLSTTGRTRMDDKNVLNDLDTKILTGKKLGLFDDFEGRQLLKCYQHGIQDSFVVGRIRRRVDGALRRLALSGSPFLPPRLNRGDFVFGFDQWNNRLLTFTQYFNAGTFQLGGTGSGKSNSSKYRAIQIAPAPGIRGMWLIDLRKREYRSLRPLLARLGIDLKIIRGRKFCINPLQVPYGVDPIEYAAVAADFLVRVLNLPPRASTLLRSTLIKLYRQHGILNGGQQYPTLFHLSEAIRTNRDANPQARRAILDNLEAILLALGPEILAYHRGWDVHELAQHHLVMELTGLPEAGKDLILNYLITAEFISRIARGISNPKMDLWISFDEGQRLFSQRKETASYGGNALIDLTGLVRGTGIGLEISVLTTSDLSTNIPNLTSTKIIGRCGSLAEYTTAGHFAGLNLDQIMWCAHHLVPGLFVGQLGEGSWRYPFLFQVPLLDKIKLRGKHVSDQEADSSVGDVVKARLLPAKI